MKTVQTLFHSLHDMVSGETSGVHVIPLHRTEYLRGKMGLGNPQIALHNLKSMVYFLCTLLEEGYSAQLYPAQLKILITK